MSADPPQFNQQQAETVANLLQHAITNLRHQRSDRSENARQLRKDWKGAYADRFFNSEEPAIERRAEALIRELQHLLKQLSNASEQAQKDVSSWEASQPVPPPVVSAP